MRRFAVDRIGAAGETLTLPDDAAHHLVRVLRGQAGDTVDLFDGHGTSATAIILGTDDSVTVRLITIRTQDASCTVLLVLAVLKGPAMDTAVRMATEAGASAILPVLAERSVARGDRSDRWSRIASSAAQQCGRADVPTVHAPTTLHEALATLPPNTLVLLAHPGSTTAPPAASDNPLALCIGPEGGWTPAEVQSIDSAHAQRVSLGPWVLRADTAAAVGTALAVAWASSESA